MDKPEKILISIFAIMLIALASMTFTAKILIPPPQTLIENDSVCGHIVVRWIETGSGATVEEEAVGFFRLLTDDCDTQISLCEKDLCLYQEGKITTYQLPKKGNLQEFIVTVDGESTVVWLRQ